MFEIKIKQSEMHLNVYHFLKLKSGNVPFYFRQELTFFLPTVQAKQNSLNILQGSAALCTKSRSPSKY